MSYKKELGFGLMRLPKNLDGTLKQDIAQKLIDFYLLQGGSYFDTGYHYINGLGESIVKLLLVNKYPRDKFKITTKLPIWFKPMNHNEMFRIFQEQLNKAEIQYYDTYFLHGVNDNFISWIDESKAFLFLQSLKDKNLINTTGFSYHGTPQGLEYLLNKYNKYIDVVQIQYNYLDQFNPLVSSYNNYQICEKFNKEVRVMEPCKGGILLNLPQNYIDKIKNFNKTPSDLALLYAATPKNVSIILSGMSSIRQIFDNLNLFKNYNSLSLKEFQLIEEIVNYLQLSNIVQCTSCNYCKSFCPKNINIPLLLNKYGSIDIMSPNEITTVLSNNFNSIKNSNFNQCIKCGICEKNCPQHLQISEYITKIKKNPVLKYELR